MCLGLCPRADAGAGHLFQHKGAALRQEAWIEIQRRVWFVDELIDGFGLFDGYFRTP